MSKKYELTIRSFNYNNCIELRLDTEFDIFLAELRIVANPTGNCQLDCVEHFEDILDILDEVTAKKDKFDITRKALKALSYASSKILLLDVRKRLKELIVGSIPKSAFMHIHDYTSTNHSKMCLIMLRRSALQKMKTK